MKTRMASRQMSQQVAFSLLIVATTIVVLPVIAIILQIVINGGSAINWDFLTQPPTQAGKAGGIFPAIMGTFYLMLGTITLALTIGVLAGIYLSEYARDNWFTRTVNMAIVNLAGVPSIVYGLFGLGVFVLAFHFGMSLLSASLTLACQALAMTVTTSREAILAVPREYREGSLAVGSTKWQTIRHIILPQMQLACEIPLQRPEKPVRIQLSITKSRLTSHIWKIDVQIDLCTFMLPCLIQTIMHHSCIFIYFPKCP